MLEVSLLNARHTEFDFVLNVKSNVNIDDRRIFYEAASPPDRITSFTSSALPFANKRQAYYESPNVNHVYLNETNEAHIHLYYPNSYYEDLGHYLVQPHVKLTYYVNSLEHTMNIKLSDNIPERTLFPDTSSPLAKSEEEVVDSQENILRKRRFRFKL